jgi:hypothetical protein
MKLHKIKLLFLLLIIFNNVYGQKLDPYKCLKRALILDNYPNLVKYDTLHTDSVPFYYNYFLLNANNKDHNFGMGVFYCAAYYYEIQSFEKADSLYELFLTIKQPKKYKIIEVKDWFSTMPDPSLYYFYVYNDLCEINLNKKNYRKALDYIILSEKSPFYHFCANAHLSRGPFVADKKAKCYIGLNEKDSALIILLPHIFNKYYKEYNELVKTTASLLKDKYKDKTKEIVEKAFGEMKTEKVKYNKTFYDKYFIEIDDVKIEIPSPTSFTKESTEKDYINYIWNSDFYKLCKN